MPTSKPAPFAFAALAALAGCSLVMDADFDKYEPAGTAGAAGGPCVPRLTINEVQTLGPNGSDDEFIELFNASDCPAPLDGVVLAYRSSSASSDHSVTWAPEAGLFVAPWWFFVIGGSAWTGPRDAVLPPGFALGASGGGLALRGAGEVVDQLGWGDAANGFVENIAAPAHASGEAIGRRPDGVDTNSNEPDFTLGVPSPGASNAP